MHGGTLADQKAGHLALGIGKAAGATLTIIPEEFRERPVKLQRVVDLLIGAVIKRLEHGRADGVAVLTTLPACRFAWVVV